MTMNSDNLLVIAAEESSCKYAIKVMRILKEKNFKLNFFGIGNQEMEQEGFLRLAKSEDLAVMGLFEILKNQKKIRTAFKDVIEAVKKNKPKAALLLDYGGFNLRLAKKLKELNVKVIYYIPPKVWVWKKNRVFKIKKYVDEVLVVHPFEVDFYKRYEIDALYVGHPLLEEYKSYKDTHFNVNLFKNKLGLEGGLTLGLMPGSRNSEIERHLNLMIEAAMLVYEKKPSINVCVLVAPGYEIEDFKSRLNKNYEHSFHFIKEDSWKMIDICDYVITASGTATLQVGLLKKPQVIIYIMNPLSARLAKIVVKGIKYFGLVNLIIGKKICPEFFQSEANPQAIASATLNLMTNASKEKDEMLKNYSNLESKLDGAGAADTVAKVIEKYL